MGMDVESLFQQYYYSDPAFIDGTTQFHRFCRDHIHSGARILEVGAGPTNRTSEYLATIGTVVGVDVSDEVMGNRSLAAADVYDGRILPYQNASFDNCVSNYVLEHVVDPQEHFRQIARVLRPGGTYCFRTPNLLHYITMASWLLPHSMHLRFANQLRGLSNEHHEPYPTLYRSNTRHAIGRMCRYADLDLADLLCIEKEPLYGRAHSLLFFPMMLYERLVNRTRILEGFRVNILGCARRVQTTESVARS
jgi:SAM-dependent methyltransferase